MGDVAISLPVYQRLFRACLFCFILCIELIVVIPSMGIAVQADVRPGDIVLVPFLVPFNPDHEVYARAIHPRPQLPVLPDPVPYDRSTSPASISKPHLHGPAMVMSVIPAVKRDYPSERELLRFPYWFGYDPEKPPQSINKATDETINGGGSSSSGVATLFIDVHVVVRLLTHPHLSYPIPLDRITPWSAVRFDKQKGQDLLDQCLSLRKELDSLPCPADIGTSDGSVEAVRILDAAEQARKEALEASFSLYRAWTVATVSSVWQITREHPCDASLNVSSQTDLALNESLDHSLPSPSVRRRLGLSYPSATHAVAIHS